MKNMNEWRAQALQLQHRLAMPIMTHPGIEMIGKTVYDAVTNGEIHYEAIKALNDKYPSAACTVIMDLTVEAEAFGAKVEFHQDDIPTVVGRLVCDEESVNALPIPELTAARLPQYLLANRLAAEHIQDKPVLAGMIGPFSLAGRLYDMSELMMDCYGEPEVAEALLDKCTTFLMSYARALKEQGVQGVVIAEPAAGLLSNDGCSEFSTQYVRRIVEAVQDDNFMVVLHNCGNMGHCTQAMVESGAQALHFGNKTDMVEALKGTPSDILVMGNLDPVSLIQSATPEEVEQATRELLERTAAYPNFIISTGCDVPPHTPEANIKAFYRAVEQFNSAHS